MKAFLVVFLGGGAGSATRYFIQLLINRTIPGSNFPVATLFINILGSLFIGLFFSLAARFNFSYETRLFLIVGICGGFTTFSTFSNENLTLLKSGSYLTFVLYVALSVFMGVAGALVGAWMGKSLL